MRVTCPDLTALNGITHGFFTREGGISQGTYALLNCGYGSGDAEQCVDINRAFVARTLGVEAGAVCTAYQIHSPTCVVLDAPWRWQDAPQADALVTTTPGIAIGVLTADCVPVLLADAKARVIGAAHAGWKGATGGVIESTLASMQQLGADRSRIHASIGPAIEQCSYEVGGEFYDRFLAEQPANESFFYPSSRNGHHMFDIKAYVKKRLTEAQVAHINVLEHDTCLEENRFFSYRRACLKGESVYGRQVSAITLK